MRKILALFCNSSRKILCQRMMMLGEGGGEVGRNKQKEK
jgi:hypothetical protein